MTFEELLTLVAIGAQIVTAELIAVVETIGVCLTVLHAGGVGIAERDCESARVVVQGVLSEGGDGSSLTWIKQKRLSVSSMLHVTCCTTL